MLTSSDLYDTLGRTRKIEAAMRSALNDLPPGVALTTKELAARIGDDASQSMIMSTLVKLAGNLNVSVKLPPEPGAFGTPIRRNSWVHLPLTHPTHALPKPPSQLDRLEQQLTRIEELLVRTKETTP